MTNHYYTNDPQSAHDYREWTFELRGHVLKFTTDSGVFSRDRVDYGSVVLLEHFETTLLPEECNLRCWLWLWWNWLNASERNRTFGRNGGRE